MTDLIPVLEQQERELLFEHFDHADAWRLGSRITAMAQAAGHPVGVDIRRPGLVLFRASLPGSTPDQESWLARKAAVVLRMESSSALVDARHSAAGVDAAASGWLGTDEYAVTGGSFPIRVRGVGVVAAATASGLASLEDHDLVVAAIRAHLAEDAASAGGSRPIRHTVAFRLPYPAGSAEETAFLDAARGALVPIPGVQGFAVRRQVGRKSDLTLQLAMTFADEAAYAAYNAHPDHVAFVRSRWEPEVQDFQELDLVEL